MYHFDQLQTKVQELHLELNQLKEPKQSIHQEILELEKKLSKTTKEFSNDFNTLQKQL
jgi:predicted  nucleic acid-binding Zn-ribbon protein